MPNRAPGHAHDKLTSMNTNRREFLTASVAVGSALALGAHARASSARGDGAPEKKLSILILGGTGFLGPAIVEAAKPRGHAITLFNRGKTRPELFPELEKLQGDRDPKKGAGITALEGRKFDVVFDDCGYYPRMVDASAQLLAKNGTAHYVFISSISAYAKNEAEGADETSATGTISDPTVESMGEGYVNYGPLKALCEQAAEKAFPGRCTNVRPGYIVGPGDPTDRFTYWPLRFQRGGKVLVPGAESDPLQVIDVRDLAEWLVHAAETRTFGTFNACGPEKRLSWGKTIEACRAASSAKDASIRWASVKELEPLGPLDFPIWAPYAGESKGFHTWSNARAVKAGMRFRTIDTTVKDTLAWWATLPEERRAKVRAGLTAEQEAAALAKLG